jgi:hypothetical protein
MPVDPLVHAAQANIVHCIINNGYNIINGGEGRVKPIQMVQPILMNQAVSSNKKRNGKVE